MSKCTNSFHSKQADDSPVIWRHTPSGSMHCEHCHSSQKTTWNILPGDWENTTVPPVNAAYITKHFLPLETAIYGVNKKAEPTHERVGTRVYSASTEVLGKKDVLKSTVAQAVSKLESDRKKTYYWNPEYVGDGSLD